MAFYYGWGSTASRLQSYYEEVVSFFTNKFSEIPQNDESGFEHRNPTAIIE